MQFKLFIGKGALPLWLLACCVASLSGLATAETAQPELPKELRAFLDTVPENVEGQKAFWEDAEYRKTIGSMPPETVNHLLRIVHKDDPDLLYARHKAIWTLIALRESSVVPLLLRLMPLDWPDGLEIPVGEALAELADDDIVEVLVKTIASNPKGPFFENAYLTIARLSRPRFERSLRRHISHQRFEVRYGVASALAGLRSEATTELMWELLEDEEPDVIWVALGYLVEKPTAEILIKLHQHMSKTLERGLTIFFIRDYRNTLEDGWSTLIKEWKAKNGLPEEINDWTKVGALLDSKNRGERIMACQMMAEDPKACAGYWKRILPLTRSDELAEEVYARGTLENMIEHAPDAFEHLLRLLGEMNDEHTFGLALMALDDASEEQIAEIVKSLKEAVANKKRRLLSLLFRLAQKGMFREVRRKSISAHLNELTPLLADPDEQTRRLTCVLLGTIGQPAKDAIPDLLKAASDREVTAQALLALAVMGRSAIPGLIEKARDADGFIRGMACMALSHVGEAFSPFDRDGPLLDDIWKKSLLTPVGEFLLSEPRAVEAVPVMIECLAELVAVYEKIARDEDQHPDIRRRAIEAFSECAAKDNDKRTALLKTFFQHPNPELATAAYTALFTHEDTQQQHLPFWTKALQHPLPDIRILALRSIAHVLKKEFSSLQGPDGLPVRTVDALTEPCRQAYARLLEAQKDREERVWKQAKKLDDELLALLNNW